MYRFHCTFVFISVEFTRKLYENMRLLITKQDTMFA